MPMKVTIEFQGTWVLEHRNDESLPVKTIFDHLKKSLGDDKLELKESSLTAMSVILSDGGVDVDSVSRAVCEALAKLYNVKNPVDIVSISSAQYDQQQDATPEAAPGKPSYKAQERAPAANESSGAPDEAKTQACLDQVQALVGCGEFKALVREFAQVAPQVHQNKTFDTITRQCLLISVNEGCGLTTYLHHLAQLFEAIRISQMASTPVLELKLPAQRKELGGNDPFSDALRVIHMSGHEMRVLCLDISEWLDDTDKPAFRDFLRQAARRENQTFLVFRVPFVDGDVLKRVRQSLNDLLFVRPVMIPPFTKDEIQACAEVMFSQHGFTLTTPAWDVFHERITDEKSDGRFYGLHTVEKVACEAMYQKQLCSAREQVDSLCITDEDIAPLCADRSRKRLTGYEMLDQMVGMDAVRARIEEIVVHIEMARHTQSAEPPCIHMRFVGSPGTGKTTAARVIGKILTEKGILRVGAFFEYHGRDFCGRYVGETAPKTVSMCRDAYGSVMFIDEAYSLYREEGYSGDYGREALDTLIAQMENHRSDMVVIMAGYTDEMDQLMRGNAGLASRMPYLIEFPNYTREQLADIYMSMLKSIRFDDGLEPAVRQYFMSLDESVVQSRTFSNARYVRNLFERTWAKAAMRCQMDGVDDIHIKKVDFDSSIIDKEFIIKKKPSIGFANTQSTL